MASILQINGRWRALIRKRGQTACQTFDTKTAAKAWAAEKEREIENGAAGIKSSVRGKTFGDLIDKYREQLSSEKRWGRSKDALLDLLKRRLGDRAVADLSAQALIEYGRTRRKEGLGPAGLGTELSLVGVVLNAARVVFNLDAPAGAAKDAIAALRQMKSVAPSRERNRRPTPAELAKLKSEIAKRRLEIPMSDLIDFAVASGLRLGEIVSLRWADIDEEKRTVVVRSRKHPDVNQKRDDVVPLLGEAWDIVQRQPRTADRIFPYRREAVSTSFWSLCRRPGVEIEDLHFHDLRHEALSRLFEKGYSIPEVSIVSGHRSWEQLKRYTQIKPESLHRDMGAGR
ncbi:MAG: site-specific integrase [Azospirillum sp.]|nr:site-specific integrase [Azospirillum sp.]MCA3264699.1 site-specific integrase [Azospirillum sp.]